MKFVFVFLFLAPLIAARFFRYDYTFYSQVDGWMKLHRVPANWNEARLRCHYEGGVLASPLNNKMLHTMQTVVDKVYHRLKIFTGISAEFSSGDFYSIEGVPLKNIHVPWAPYEPNNSKDEEHCITLTHGALADVSCKEPHPYICYKSNPQDIPTPGKCGTTDPEYIYDDRTSHCYKFHNRGQIWSKAFMTCAAEGGYLAIVNSDKEAQVLKDIFDKHGTNTLIAKYTDAAFIGTYSQLAFVENDPATYSWMTIHGQTLKEAGYENWAPNQPDNYTTGEYCGSFRRGAVMNDLSCNIPMAFFCEKTPGSLLDNDSGSTDEIERQ